jgi:hypothetical protein
MIWHEQFMAEARYKTAHMGPRWTWKLEHAVHWMHRLLLLQFSAILFWIKPQNRGKPELSHLPSELSPSWFLCYLKVEIDSCETMLKRSSRETETSGKAVPQLVGHFFFLDDVTQLHWKSITEIWRSCSCWLAALHLPGDHGGKGDNSVLVYHHRHLPLTWASMLLET